MTVLFGIIAVFFALQVMIEKEERKRLHFTWCFVATLAALVLKSLI